jgi:branched-chain amino acid transport system ATP-binding protein
MNMLEISDLHVKMGVHPILRGVSLAVPESGVIAILGANGVGKTTLMRAVSGVYSVSQGSIRLRGTEIANLRSSRIVAMGIAQAPEGRQIFGAMSVRENLILGASAASRPRFAEVLERVLAMFPVLRDRLKQRAGSLSGGEQQMLCIGRALMSEPKLLLLDEPSLGLAPKVVRQIFDLIQQIRAQGSAILLVEQNARAALKVADFGYVMEGGAIVLEGTAAQLAADPRVRHAYLGGV